ncbi:hypothetical protein QEJ31_13790 [Pigmentibacter sp. JX0631]|uniref:hypothetical protein n=1 Tax=Pigmentibacter sp. JX0631 TaxID=2976982 RepID=UPI0024694835|nr:hypothetical protein [Pigmentibacter sp. JX0631]WGL59598.1 hypothetical protein QEJ31_13790 [Pigmentibacter sp. JX0631]
MKKTIIILLRFLIVFLLFLPIIFPFIEKKNSTGTNSVIQIFIPEEIKLSYIEKDKIQKIINDQFGQETKGNYVTYGKENNLPIQDYDDLITQIKNYSGTSVIVSNSHFFGEEAKKFNSQLKETRNYKENRLFIMPMEKLFNNINIPENYLVLSDIFIPKISFLGEESTANIHIIGKIKSHQEIKGEIILHSGNSFLNAKSFKIEIPSNGLINTIIDVPINFSKIGNQIVTADVTSAFTKQPLNSVSTNVQVVYSKSTFLHISVGPDWSLRTLRQKLKFWPNLDLLSYYILRETTSDQSIPNSQLSLIEFPADKLFGSSLQNFHGIIAQNFLFDTYLGEKESSNLINYVANGGRLVIQAGPLSFLSDNNLINSIFPCENKPSWDFKNKHYWKANETNFVTDEIFKESLSNLVTNYTALNCKPKKEAIVLAKTTDDESPVLLAMPYQKGIVLSFLGADWIYGYTQEKLENHAAIALRMRGAESSENIFNWMVEFLQRRQDSGIKGPDLVGPRIYAEDKYLQIKSRGGLQTNKSIFISSNLKNEIASTPFLLTNLQKEMLKLDSPLSVILPKLNATNGINSDISLSLQNKNVEQPKFQTWPVFSGTAKSQENLENPFLFEGIPELLKISTDLTKDITAVSKKVALLDAYPWLLACALFLLTIEQLFTRVFWRNELQKP